MPSSVRNHRQFTSPQRQEVHETLWRVAIFASLLVAGLVPLVAFTEMFPLVDNFPKWDQWHLIPLWHAYYSGGDIKPFLLAPYNGHLNLLPRLIFLGMGILTRWDVRFEVALSFVLACGTLITILFMLKDSDRRLLVLSAPAAAHVFSFTQFENFHSGYAMGQNLSQFAATVAVYLLTRPEVRPGDIVGAAIASAAATFSWGAGLAAWAVGAIALFLHERWRRIAFAWIVLSGGCALAVLSGARGLRPALHLRQFTIFFITLFGKPVVIQPFPSPRTALLAGTLVIGALVALVAVCTRLRMYDTVRRWTLYSLLAFGSAALITLGRYGSGSQQALVSHYVTAVFPVIIAVLVLMTSFALQQMDSRPDSPVARWGSALIIVFSAIAFLQPVIVSARTLTTLRGWVEINRADTAKVIHGTATDAEIHRSLHPNAELVREGTIVLRHYQLSGFAARSRVAPNASPTTVVVAPSPSASPKGTRPHSAPGPALPESAFRIRWVKFVAPSTVAAGGRVHATIVFVNSSDVTWPVRKFTPSGRGGADFVVRLGYRWLKAPEPWNRYTFSHRADIPSPVRPGETVTLTFDAEAPPFPGRYELQVDALQELVAWFEGKGADRLVTNIEVVQARLPVASPDNTARQAVRP